MTSASHALQRQYIHTDLDQGVYGQDSSQASMTTAPIQAHACAVDVRAYNLSSLVGSAASFVGQLPGEDCRV